MCFCWYWHRWTLLCWNTLLLSCLTETWQELHISKRVAGFHPRQGEGLKACFLAQSLVIIEPGESVCFWNHLNLWDRSLHTYTCAARAGRSRGLVSELSVGVGVCRSCVHHLNVFNPGSVRAEREVKEEALWEVSGLETTQRIMGKGEPDQESSQRSILRASGGAFDDSSLL